MIVADVGSGKIEAAAVFVSLYTDPGDVMRIGGHLQPMLIEAVERWHAGDVSPATARLVGLARVVGDGLAIRDAETAAAKAERIAERRAATLAAIHPPPDIADRMTGVGLRGLPLPDDAVPDEDHLATRVATPDALMAFYIEHMRASGWTLDCDHSNPLTKTDPVVQPLCYFTRPDIPGRYIWILTGAGVDDPGLTGLWISEDND